ncbi:MAG TPA: hypothetical protein DDY98_05575 [Ruminococcaceae bacterium]|nr:hypothetical protein [Oscillospiraceae bacterium]
MMKKNTTEETSMKKLLSLILSAIFLFPLSVCFSVAAVTQTIFVSPDGNDANTGSFSAPLATLSAAKAKAKTCQGNVTVYFRGGSYTISEPVCFNSSDRANVTYKAYGDDEPVVFTSGVPYTGFERCSVNGVSAFKKSVGKQTDFNVLFNEKTTLKRTRYPSDGYLYVSQLSMEDVVNPETDTELFYNCKGLITKDKIPAFKNLNDVVIRILHYWKDEMATVTSYDEASGHLTYSRPSTMRVAEGERFFFENVFEQLKNPGEWYLDKTEGVLYYIPYAGEQPETLTLWGSETETMISVDGVDGISFENILFRGNGFSIPRQNKYSDISSQAGYDAAPCVSYKNAKDFTVKNCEFKDMAGCAVFVGAAVQNATVENNYFENLGAQAVYVRGENVAVDAPNVTKNITVYNNCINGYGKVFYNSVGVLVIHANSVNILNNEIHDGYYSAVSVGWRWGYDYSITYNNKICDNLIYDIGQGWLSDMGGIYTLGVQTGTVLSGNVIHNVAADPGEGGYGGWGIYPDEGSSNMLIEKNLVYACGNDSYHLHYGENNTVRNNIFALSGESQVRVQSRLDGKHTATFTDNILLTDGKAATFSHMTEKASFTANHNFLWDLTYGEEVYVNVKGNSKNSLTALTAQRFGWLNNSVIVNPMFRDAKNFDFYLSANSPAVKDGFEAWDYSKAGTVSGTTIGLNRVGGQTPYNANSKTQNYTESYTFFTNLLRIFRVAFDWLTNLFT